ncbi:hypothetical protein IMZ31_23770 (plasmid) [Pontibacillus sp. ALD_SL1]|uniref:hypothetical protein n=1 Tax=Pontibacillus sp. ALD_SL1 TaxID=2777185 RepID=UPI001A96858A|nr:hypothetical protein [Pontibacillus sp. ALD_SL1]QST02471.1 hypothetical protein IMZ31_23770 [Pontibacillus sp. ALD_SL1]
MKRLNTEEWCHILRNLEEEGQEVEIVWLDAVPFDGDGHPTGEENEWVLCFGTELFEDGFRTEREAEERLEEIKRTVT